MRIRRADLPEQNSQAVYQRMQTERQREAAEFRAQGTQRAQEIRARADRDVTVLVAEAQLARPSRSAARATPKRNQHLRRAFGKDPDFFAFYRSMQAYETGLRAQRHAAGAQAGLRLLPLLRRSGGQVRGRRRRRRTAPTALARCGQRSARSQRRTERDGPARCRISWPRSGLVFVIEGLMFAAFPATAKRAMDERAGDAGCTSLRLIGIGSAHARPRRWSGWCAASCERIRQAGIPPKSA